MSAKWESVCLGSILQRSGLTISLEPEIKYREVTVRINGKGVVERRQVQGSEIASSRRYQVRTGQFIISRIDARHGASGLIPPELDGAVVTNDFPVFDIRQDALLPDFLAWLSKTRSFVELCKRASEGTTNRVRLSEERFNALEIRLPSLDVQRRIVAIIENLVAKVQEVRGLRAEADEAQDALLCARTTERFAELEAKGYARRSFGSCDSHVSSGPRNWGKHYATNGWRFYRAQDIGRDFRVSQDNIVYVEAPSGEQGRSAKLQDGDLLIVITGATVGRAAAFDSSLPAGLVSQHVSVCRLPQDVFLPRFALWGLRGSDGQAQLLGSKYGQGKPGLNLDQVRNLSLPCPPTDVQRQIIAELDLLNAKVSAAKKLQTESALELDAMVPAILDKAFKGELA